jgi:hypothetical protein
MGCYGKVDAETQGEGKKGNFDHTTYKSYYIVKHPQTTVFITIHYNSLPI